MKTNIIVIFSSQLSEEANNEFINHIHDTIGVKHKVVCYPNFNQYSLSEIYNRGIKEYYEKNSIFVMCHNDIIIKTKNWGKSLLTKYNCTNFDIVGLAGSTYLPESGMWWEDRSKMCGIVGHTDGNNTWISEYSNEIYNVKDVVLIDGVFMSFNPDTIIHKFDENYKGFHFYDLSFCIPNYLDGCNIGVTTSIRILHKSVGEVNNQWDNNRKQFIKQYKNELSIKHISEDKLKVLICCQFFKNYTGSEVSNYELSRELVKLGCDVTIISSVVGEPLLSKAQKNGVKVYHIASAPNYRINNENQLVFYKNEIDFDIIHINHKPIGEQILQMYPNTPAVMHIRSEVIPVFEEPIINSNIKKYISIRETITDYIKTFNISDSNITIIDNPFDTKRFNVNYKQIKNKKEVVLFIGTIDHLRQRIISDLVWTTQNNNQELWIIGENILNIDITNMNNHVKYFGVKSNVEDFIKKCDYTAGIFKGRTTIEGFLCGKPGWIYTVNNKGEILNKELQQVPDDIEKYHSNISAKKIHDLYLEVLKQN